MAGRLWRGSVSERGLARSVAHRLKYYIDVQRKEDSFNSSGVIHDETESLYRHPACLTEEKEHDFANIKLEASLRAFMGTAEDCSRKVQKSPEKQKDLEKRIKKMAQNYIPERKSEGKGKNIRRQKRPHRTSHSLHIAATPFMSPEEVQRLVSSASKLIVAAISDISPEELRTTQKDVSFPNRREAKTIETLDNGNKQQFSSTHFYKDGSRRAKQERKNGEDVEGTTEIPNISSNSAKSKRFFSRPLPKPTARSSLNRSSVVSGLQTGENKMLRKGILKSGTSASGTSSVISEHQDKRTPNAQEKAFSVSQESAPNSDGCFRNSMKTEMEAFSHRPAEIVSSKTNQASKCLDPRPILHFISNQECGILKSNNAKHSAESTTEVISTQLSMAGKKNNQQGNSTAVSECIVLHEQSEHMGDQDNPKRNLLGDSERNWPQKDEQNTCDSMSEKNSEYDQAYFEKNQQGYIPTYHFLKSCSLHHLRGPEDATLAPSMIGKPTGHVTCVQEDQNNDPVSMVKHGSSFLYKLCQEMDRDSPANVMMKRSMTAYENEGNQSTHSLLNSPFSLNELGDGNIIQDPVSCMKMQDITLGESSDQQLLHIPPERPDGSRCSELLSNCVSESLQQRNSGSLVIAPAISEKLESEQSEEEFTMSSASSSSSAVSLTRVNEQQNGNAKDDADSSMKMVPEKVLKVMSENGTTWRNIVCQDSGKQRITAEERTNMDRGTEGICASQIVYFSNFPKSYHRIIES